MQHVVIKVVLLVPEVEVAAARYDVGDLEEVPEKLAGVGLVYVVGLAQLQGHAH